MRSTPALPPGGRFYRVVAVKAADIAVLTSASGEQLFVCAVGRKATTCAMCRQVIAPGARSWRTVNQSTMNRADRLCADHFPRDV